MGKLSKQQQLPVVQPQRRQAAGSVCSRIFCCQRCSTGVSKAFNFKCLVVLILTFALSVYALFSVLPLLRQSNKLSGFDAKDSIKLAASAQAYFRLQKPASELIPHISELENEIYGEIGIPSAKVAILSMHQPGTSNWTDVTFGVLPDPLHSSIEPEHLTLLRITLTELFLQVSNLTLTTTFGKPFSFDILTFPGGITLIPEQAYHFGEIPEILFNFTLNNSIHEIIENFVALSRELRFGLHLMPKENVYIQVENNIGSTRDPPVVVEASITSDLGNLMPQRLRQLAEIIRRSSGKNLGLDNSVFGKVKEVILSSCLNHSVHTLPPSPSPSPSPELIWDNGPSLSPSGPPSPAHLRYLAPCSHCDASTPDASQAFSPSPDSDNHLIRPPVPNSPAPSMTHDNPNCGSRISPSSSPISHDNPVFSNLLPPTAPPPEESKPEMPLGPSPLPVVSYDSSHGRNDGKGKNLVSPPGVLPSISASSSSLFQGSLYKIWWMCLLELLTLHLVCSVFHVD